MRAIICSACLLLLLGGAPVIGAPMAFTASYDAYSRGIRLGEGTIALNRRADDYRYQMRVRPSGVASKLYPVQIDEVSDGVLTSEGVRPQRYEYRREGRGERYSRIDFLRHEQQLTLVYRHQETGRPAPPATVDRLSLQLALMRDLSQGKTRMRYLVAERDRLKAYRLEVTGREVLDTPLGTVETLRVQVTGELPVANGAGFSLERAPMRPMAKNDQTTLWYAPELGYIPVRIHHVNPDDGSFELRLTELQ